MMDDYSVSQPLFSRVLGNGNRKGLAIHCTLAHSGAWRRLTDVMDGEIELTAVDMLSHGKSPDWDRQGDFHDRVVQATVPFLGEGIDLMGHSFGATVALNLARTYPDRVRSLTLFEPIMVAAAALDDPAIIDVLIAEERPIYDACAAGDEALAARLFNRKWSEGGPRWPDMPEALRAALTRGIHVVPASSPTVVYDRPGLLKPDSLAKVSMPVLLVSGAGTNPVVSAACEALRSRLPDAVHEIVSGAGHMVPVTHPDESAQLLRAHFQRC